MADDDVPCRGEGEYFPASQFRKRSGYVVHWTVDPRHTKDGEPWPPPDLPTGDVEVTALNEGDIREMNDQWRSDG